MRFMLAEALVGSKRAREGAQLYRSALDLVGQIPQSALLDRTIAITSNNLSLLIGVGSRRRSASQAIDLPSDGGVNFGRLFTPASTGGGVRPSRPLSALTSAGWCR